MDAIGLTPVPVSPLGAAPESLAVQARAGDPRSIERVAADFEAMFVSLVLKEMRQTLEPGSLFGMDAGDSFGGLFDLYLGKHLAQSGGFGVGEMVRQYLEGYGTK
jgi:flagellar protein FlgJ